MRLYDCIPKIAEACKGVSEQNHVLAAITEHGELFLDEVVGPHSLIGARESRCFRGGLTADLIEYDLDMVEYWNLPK